MRPSFISFFLELSLGTLSGKLLKRTAVIGGLTQLKTGFSAGTQLSIP